jgi:hypothetical protein
MIRHLVILAVMLLAGCSSVTSIRQERAGSEDGLAYYMPKRDFLVTLTVSSEGKVTDASFAATDNYPDLSQPYMLTYSRNLVGKNSLDVSINEQGLLTTTTSITTSGMSDILKGLATTAGTLAGTKALPPDGEKPTACKQGQYVFRVEARTQVKEACDVRLGIKLLVGAGTPPKDTQPNFREADVQHAGLFYRQQRPYTLEVISTDDSFRKAAILLSPSESPTRFLPMARTLFANNQAEFTFTAGVPTKYKQDADGELVALLKLPADVISAYFSAIGSIFDNFKSRDEKEVAALNASTKLELATVKYEACKAALKSKDEEVLKKLGC